VMVCKPGANTSFFLRHMNYHENSSLIIRVCSTVSLSDTYFTSCAAQIFHPDRWLMANTAQFVVVLEIFVDQESSVVALLEPR